MALSGAEEEDAQTLVEDPAMRKSWFDFFAVSALALQAKKWQSVIWFPRGLYTSLKDTVCGGILELKRDMEPQHRIKRKKCMGDEKPTRASGFC